MEQNPRDVQEYCEGNEASAQRDEEGDRFCAACDAHRR
jgi:hypothetical protein